MLRVNDPQGDPVGAADNVEGLRRQVERLVPGRYHVDEIDAGPGVSRRDSRLSASWAMPPCPAPDGSGGRAAPGIT